MIVSRTWLGDYVSVTSVSVEEITNRLTMSGLNLEEFHPVGEDVAIDLEVTSNRADCLGHIGVAREIAVLFDTSLSIPDARPQEGSQSVSDLVSVENHCPELCHEYHARLIRGVRIGPSPAWLADRLAAVGINSVNNVVDVTNYVMLECGQPLHAFDFDKLAGGRIIVRRALPKESLTAIDQRAYELPADACVIADARRAAAVAGVMGGLESEISDQTVNVLIEAASFDPVSVRATARALKLHSPSSYRFERRVDRTQLDWASRRCCELILQVAGGELLQGSVVAGGRDNSDRTPVTLRFAQVPRLLGITIPDDDCVRILERLGLTCRSRTKNEAGFVPPSWRRDLQRECDLIEEVARIHGYDRIPDDAVLPVIATAKTHWEHVLDSVRTTLIASGISEAMTLSFVSEELTRLVRPRGELPVLSVSHSSRVHESQLRQTLIPSLLQCRRHNERHGNFGVSLYEVARVYLSADKAHPEEHAEPTVVGVVSCGSFLQLKGTVETLVTQLVPDADLECRAVSLPYCASGRSAEVLLNGVRLGWIGELHRDILTAFELQDAVVAAELDANLLLRHYDPARTVRPLPRFPAISRDLNFVIPEATTWQQLSRTVSSSGGEWLKQVSFAGQYRGSQLGPGKKSYVVNCRFAADDRTLKAEEVDAAVTRIVSACEGGLTAVLRT